MKKILPALLLIAILPVASFASSRSNNKSDSADRRSAQGLEHAADQAFDVSSGHSDYYSGNCPASVPDSGGTALLLSGGLGALVVLKRRSLF